VGLSGTSRFSGEIVHHHGARSAFEASILEVSLVEASVLQNGTYYEGHRHA
jgi:hypothetical protein